MQNLLISTTAILVAGAAFAAAAQSAQLPDGAAHNIVLVHGAFVDQTSWKPVADILAKKGFNVTLSALVYVSAFAPDVGESLAALANAGPATEGGRAIHPDKKGDLTIDPKVFPSAVAADLPLKIAESLANSQLPLNHVAFEAPVDIAAWRDKPTFYVISTKDKVIAPEAQKLFATRMKAQTTEVAGSHASLVVHAQEVAAVIEKAALAE
jgi:pimeloyl-ACP methyl ester carboxylesterase